MTLRSRLVLLGSAVATASLPCVVPRPFLVHAHTTPALILSQQLVNSRRPLSSSSKPFDYENESEEALESLCERFEIILQVTTVSFYSLGRFESCKIND